MVEHASDELISAYADNELEAGDRESIARHLEACAICRQRLSELDWSRQRLAILRQESWRPDVYPRVMSRIGGRGYAGWLHRTVAQVITAASMALVLVIMGAAMVILLESRPQQVETPLSPETAKALKERPEGKGDLSAVSGLVYIVDQGKVAWSPIFPQYPMAIVEPPQVLVFDPSRGETIRRIPVGPAPVVVPSPQGDRLYVTSVENEQRKRVEYLSVLDTQSGQELTRIESQDKTPLALSPDGRLLYLLHIEQMGDKTRRHLNVFDTQALQMLPYDIPSDPTAFRLDSSGIRLFGSPDGNWLYALGVLSGPGIARVEFLDVARREVVDTLELPSEEPCGAFSYAGVLSPDGNYLYAVNTLEKRVDVIDVTRRSILRNDIFDPSRSSRGRGLLHAVRDLLVTTAWAKGCFSPPSATISPDGSKIYVGGYEEANSLGDGLWVIDTRTLQTIAHLYPPASQYLSLGFGPDSHYLFGLRVSLRQRANWNAAGGVSNALFEYRIVVIDTASNRTIAEFSDIAVNPTQIFVLPR